MTAPLPVVGGSTDTWGTLLNEYLIEIEARISALESGVGGGGGFITAPDGDFITDPSGNSISTFQELPNRLLTDTATVVWDFSVSGQMKATLEES